MIDVVFWLVFVCCGAWDYYVNIQKSNNRASIIASERSATRFKK